MKQRVLSLLSSTTEIIYALGCGDRLVGRSHECDYPEEVSELPICTIPKFNVDGTSREVDDEVKSLVQSALSIYYINEKLLKELKPDIIFTQSQCEVCAVSVSDVENALKNITGLSSRVISVEPNSIEDIFNDILTIAEILNVRNKGKELVELIKAKIDSTEKIVYQKSSPSVAAIEWIDPLMAAGNWVPQLIRVAVGKNLFGEAGKHSPWMKYNDLVEQDPEIIIVMPCGYDIKKSLIEIKTLESKKGWGSLKAVRNRNVYITDGNQFFNRPGPRIIESLEILLEIIHSDFSESKHIDSGWIKLN
ncbi:MAG: cobalamin-binding protein [bacterium TMED80]|nr:MAG: cobalamin-binding protein [bacterium TMED80]